MLFQEPELSYTARLRASALRLVHGAGGPVCCAVCGEDEHAVLELHHRHHDGHRWRPIHGTGTALYRYLLFQPDQPKPELQVLCSSCHSRVTRQGIR